MMRLLLIAMGCALSASSASAQSWMTPELVAPARAEGGLTVYSSMNEQEALPIWRLFEQASGIKVAYVRGSDTNLLARVAIEIRAGKPSWDILVSTAASRLPPQFLKITERPEAKAINAQARDPNRSWYGVYANYNVPAYNTKLIKPADLPKSYEDFARRADWKGKVAIDHTDAQWLDAMFIHYGEDRARKLVGDMIATLNPVLVDGHLALARSVASGEYAVALNNYMNLTLNQQLAGGQTDYWPLEPIALFYGQVGVSAQAAHPNAALLAANFILSREAQSLLPHGGRLPVRADVTPNPPDAIERLAGKTVIVTNFAGDDERKWQRAFQDLFRPR